MSTTPFWNDEKDAILRSLWDANTIQGIADMMGVAFDTVQRHAKEIGLTRPDSRTRGKYRKRQPSHIVRQAINPVSESCIRPIPLSRLMAGR